MNIKIVLDENQEKTKIINGHVGDIFYYHKTVSGGGDTYEYFGTFEITDMDEIHVWAKQCQSCPHSESNYIPDYIRCYDSHVTSAAKKMPAGEWPKVYRFCWDAEVYFWKPEPSKPKKGRKDTAKAEPEVPAFPAIGQKVYIVYTDFMVCEEVEMKGKEEFATPRCFSDLYVPFCRQPLRYDEYGITWFTDYEQAYDTLAADLHKGEYIKKFDDNYWEIRVVEDGGGESEEESEEAEEPEEEIKEEETNYTIHNTKQRKRKSND